MNKEDYEVEDTQLNWHVVRETHIEEMPGENKEEKNRHAIQVVNELVENYDEVDLGDRRQRKIWPNENEKVVAITENDLELRHIIQEEFVALAVAVVESRFNKLNKKVRAVQEFSKVREKLKNEVKKVTK